MACTNVPTTSFNPVISAGLETAEVMAAVTSALTVAEAVAMRRVASCNAVTVAADVVVSAESIKAI
jgi:hypothetical protein